MPYTESHQNYNVYHSEKVSGYRGCFTANVKGQITLYDTLNDIQSVFDCQEKCLQHQSKLKLRFSKLEMLKGLLFLSQDANSSSGRVRAM